ncbi:class I SAM-dependent methyltransferase [Rhodopila sp.]|uniref:class I SAM-dependent methyltransferase n=1 Tax=Rhodopila sp. TaxID=2480087 RepID=UPI002C6E8EA7|nr:class I SAM-dependent methyltransferase [Rhodopila sp.]HVZ07710.1 class I SAM-dependent methyltransferase [Rhodopila sp.]
MKNATDQGTAIPAAYSKERREIAPLLPGRFDSVLEIGCGSGSTMAWLRRTRAVEYAAGVEYAEAAASLARPHFDDLEIGDAATTPMRFKREHFDLVLALDVLEHIPYPETTVARLAERLKPGGTMVVSLPNIAHYHASVPLFLRGQWTYGRDGILDRTHLRFFSEAGARALIEGSGLRITSIRYNFHYPSPLSCFGVTNPKWLWASRRLAGLFLIWPKHLFKYQFLIAATRPKERAREDGH